MCYLIAKEFNKKGCIAVKTRHGKALADFTEKLQKQIGYHFRTYSALSRLQNQDIPFYADIYAANYSTVCHSKYLPEFLSDNGSDQAENKYALLDSHHLSLFHDSYRQSVLLPAFPHLFKFFENCLTKAKWKEVLSIA